MKKRLFNLIQLISGLFILGLSVSCENFIRGNDLIKELEAEIAEINAPKVEVNVSADLNQGTTNPSGSISKKVGYPFTVSFSQATGFQFKCWEAVDLKTGNVLGDTVKFTNITALETEVTVTSEIENVRIRPVCYERSVSSLTSPVYSDLGVSRDSSIIITFTKNISDKNDFSKIKILCGGEDVSSCFLTPVLNGNLLTIAADKTNLIDVENGKTKTVTITLPSELYYIEDGINIPMSSDSNFSYKINSTTNTKSEITVSTVNGIVIPNGTKSYSIGESFTLSFSPNDGYNFYGWNIVDGEGKNVPESKLKFENNQVTVLSEISGVSITPKSSLIPKVSASPSSVVAGVSYDKDVVFTFNKNLDSETVSLSTEENPLGGSINILNFADANEHVEKYFELKCEENKITLSPKNEIKNLVSSPNSVFGFKIEFNANGNVIKDTEGFDLEGTTSYVYKINSTYEDLPMTVSIKASKKRDGFSNESNLLKAGRFESLISELTTENFFTDTYHVNSIYFNLDVYDEVGGPAKLEIEEKVLYTASGVDLRNMNVLSVNEIDLSGLESSNGNYSGVVEYTFDKELPDGIVEISVTPIDVYGRRGNTVVYSVVKNIVNNLQTYFRGWGLGLSEDLEEQLIASKQIVVGIYDEVIASYGDKVFVLSPDDFKINVTLVDINKNKIEDGEFREKYDTEYSTEGWIEFTFNFEKFNGDSDFIFLIEITDANDTKYYKEQYFYACPKISYIEKVSDVEPKDANDPTEGYLLNFEINSDSGYVKDGIEYIWVEQDSEGNKKASRYYLCEDGNSWADKYSDIIPCTGYPVELYLRYVGYDSTYYYGPITSPYIINNQSLEKGTASDLENPSFSVTVEAVEQFNSNQFVINVDASDDYEKYDSMKISVKNDGDVLNYYQLENGKVSIYKDVKSYDDLKLTLVLFGIKDGKIYSSSNLVKNLNELNVGDYCSPFLEWLGRRTDTDFSEYDYLILRLNDYPSWSVDNLMKDGKIEVDCYWTPTWNSMLSYTDEEIQQLPYKKTFTFESVNKIPTETPVKPYVKIPVDEFADFNKLSSRVGVFFGIKDNSGNTKFTNNMYTFTFSLLEGKTKIDSDNMISFENTLPLYNGFMHVRSFNSTTSKWEDSKIYRLNSSGSGYRAILSSDLAKTQIKTIRAKGRFVESWVSYGDEDFYNSDHDMTQPVIVYYTDTPSDRVCAAKSYIYNKQLTVISDKPAFVHTIYSPVDFGDEAGKWERYAYYSHRINPVVLDPSVSGSTFNNYEIDLSSIPEEYQNSYKVVIIHYADGSTELIKIK